MERFARRHHFFSLAVTLLLASCGGGRGAVETGPAPARVSRPASEQDGDLEAIYRARVDSAKRRYTEADVRFMTGMISHHAQALVMSAWAPSHGASRPVRILTSRIINAQRDEISTMQTWLRDRDLAVPEVELTDGGMMVHGAGGVMMMPGMLSEEKMQALGAAHGPEFDRLFLTYMIEHHRGAVTMVHQLFAQDGAGQDEVVFKFASDVQVDQTTEIARMELMLRELDAGTGRPGVR